MPRTLPRALPDIACREHTREVHTKMSGVDRYEVDADKVPPQAGGGLVRACRMACYALQIDSDEFKKVHCTRFCGRGVFVY